MRDNDGRKLDHGTLEVLRMRAVEQVEAGAHPEDVAVTMGFHKNTVYGWLAKVRGGGRDALKAKAILVVLRSLARNRSRSCTR